MRSPLRFVIVRRTAALLAIAAAATLAACNSDRAMGPTDNMTSTAMELGGVINGGVLQGTANTPGEELISKTALAWPTPLKRAITRSYTVLKRSGSTLEFPEVGLKVQVPIGAIPTTTMTITITAMAGVGVAYSFEPHGTVFLKPLIVQQDLSFTSWEGNTGSRVIGAGYFANDYQVNPLTGVTLLNCLMTAKVTGKSLTFEVGHFSGYMVSMD